MPGGKKAERSLIFALIARAVSMALAQVKTMRLELIAHAQALYARKWQLRAAIEAATTPEELNAIVIDFSDLQSVAVSAE